jgi:hypothetical protein
MWSFVLDDAQVVVETLLGSALAPAVSFYFLDVVFELLTVMETLVALHLLVKVVEWLVVMVVVRGLLRHYLVLLQFLGLLQLILLLNDPVASELVKVLV